MDIKRLGEQLSAQRKAKGLSLEKLAGLSKVAKNTINALELGRGNPTFETVVALARALTCSLSDLYIDEDGGGGATKQSRSDASLLDTLSLLDAIATASAPRRALIYALIYKDESYLDDLSLPKDFSRAAQALVKVP